MTNLIASAKLFSFWPNMQVHKECCFETILILTKVLSTLFWEFFWRIKRVAYVFQALNAWFYFPQWKIILKKCQTYYTSVAVATTSNNIITGLPFLLILDYYQEFRLFETNPFFCPQMLQCEIVSSVCLVGRCNYAYGWQSQAALYFWYFLTHPLTYCTMLWFCDGSKWETWLYYSEQRVVEPLRNRLKMLDISI